VQDRQSQLPVGGAGKGNTPAAGCCGALFCAGLSAPFICNSANAVILLFTTCKTGKLNCLWAVLARGTHLLLPAAVPCFAPGYRLHLPVTKQTLSDAIHKLQVRQSSCGCRKVSLHSLPSWEVATGTQRPQIRAESSHITMSSPGWRATVHMHGHDRMWFWLLSKKLSCFLG
jgi:hypothetical protein